MLKQLAFELQSLKLFIFFCTIFNLFCKYNAKFVIFLSFIIIRENNCKVMIFSLRFNYQILTSNSFEFAGV